MRKFILLIFFLTFFVQPSLAQTSPQQSEIKPLPNRNGNFSALLIITDPESHKTLLIPDPRIPYLVAKKTAKPGDNVIADILFSGMALDKNKLAHITADITILGPDNQIYDKADFKDFEIFKGEILGSTRKIYHNPRFIGIKFASKDKPGTYVFLVNLKDNIGQRQITLKSQVELTK